GDRSVEARAGGRGDGRGPAAEQRVDVRPGRRRWRRQRPGRQRRRQRPRGGRPVATGHRHPRPGGARRREPRAPDHL
ncbi:MAG: hypothetical protein AVDCRST_MAG66-1921, partial [uncultured Pseudonocardia sp.]